jgi:hypothetical protein
MYRVFNASLQKLPLRIVAINSNLCPAILLYKSGIMHYLCFELLLLQALAWLADKRSCHSSCFLADSGYLYHVRTTIHQPFLLPKPLELADWTQSPKPLHGTIKALLYTKIFDGS